MIEESPAVLFHWNALDQIFVVNDELTRQVLDLQKFAAERRNSTLISVQFT